jgi:RNA polymerase sigma factor (TIGR02999 family)
MTPVWSGGLHTEATRENSVMGNIAVMTAEQSGSVTGMLEAAGQGDKTAIGQLYGVLYPELRSIAHQRIRSLNNVQMLDTTSLVHESYLRLVKAGRVNVENRKHFLAYAAHVMRSVVVDFVRHSRTERAGGAELHVTLNSEVLDAVASPADEILRMHEFLEELAQVDERLVSVIEMRYFAGLDNDQIADVLGVTDRTIRRDLEKARLLLLDALL